MNRTGNSGPPDSSLERTLRSESTLLSADTVSNINLFRSIISLDESVPGSSRRLAPRGRMVTRPVMLDPQPIISAANSRR